ncbi:MAG: tRNA (adenosine(37)-N6)-threonylcarbamoyltransferase complex dimerization subunit type 1 TsaB [Alphaproteobacteria bacterium]|nr:MAG: tRNA (adenosine(37)-N6)-threonylcarbamoyltransferase complex dimerization subunit type 1 TsaB [Alphaproteobacteria bacterium]
MLLAIDSATAACSAALFERGRLVAERHEVVGRGHAERLVPMIAELIGTRRPTEILVDCGPGSFTGVRVGLAAAHGLAIGWGVPLAGYSSLAAVAAQAEGEEVTVALQGGHGELFVQSFAGDPLRPLDEMRSLRPEDAALAAAGRLVIGSGAEALVAARGHGEWRGALPRAADAAGLPEALRSLAPVPIYGRAPDAKPMGA